MKFCSRCGSAEIESKIPDGDNRARFCCPDCDIIFYENPKIVTGCVVTHEDKVLLCKRAIEPRLGSWTLPAGFMENNETIQQGAARETYEEATATVADLSLFAVYNLTHISQVYMMFRAELDRPEASPGVESLETEFVLEQDIPWDDLAFPVIDETLKLFFADRKAGKYNVHHGEITRLADRTLRTTRF